MRFELIPPNKQFSDRELIDDLRNVSATLKKNSVTLKEYQLGRLYNSTDEDYFENIFAVWQTLGRQPKYHEMTAPLSKLNISSYERKFGTWRSALEKFIEYINAKEKEDVADIKTPAQHKSKVKTGMNLPVQAEKTQQKQRTNRTANLRQRFRVMKRDGFKCILCGTSPAIAPGCELHIDHIIPWSCGGETIEENLRTLCSSCNLGRSNRE